MRSSIALSTIATTTPYCHYRLCNSSLLQVIIFSLILLLIWMLAFVYRCSGFGASYRGPIYGRLLSSVVKLIFIPSQHLSRLLACSQAVRIIENRWELDLLWISEVWSVFWQSVPGRFVKLLYLSSYLSMGCELDFDSFMTFEVHFYIILRTRFTMTFLIPVFPVCIMEIKSLRLLFKSQAPHPAPHRSRELCNSVCLLPFKTLDQWLQPSLLGSCF